VSWGGEYNINGIVACLACLRPADCVVLVQSRGWEAAPGQVLS
jgi:hypothetical protein